MNVLFLSNIKGKKAAGPTYSVPKQVLAQQVYDNVFWYNTIDVLDQDWTGDANYHDLSEYPSKKIADLPAPFNNPDIVIVEQFYNHVRDPYVWELISGNIPYIIIPRGEFTWQAQKFHSLKKQIANFLFFRKFSKQAVAIQYLTANEHDDSGIKWNKNSIVIPNGIDILSNSEKNFNSGRIDCVSIGRIALYQKGYDLLIQASANIKDELESANVHITLYGPDKYGSKKKLDQLIQKNKLDKIIKIEDVVFDDEKREKLMLCDVFLMPSRFEGLPMALIEAMSYGIPVLATEGSNMANEVIQYDAGWGCKTSIKGIEEALITMIKEQYKFKEKSSNAVKLAEKYSWDSIAKKSHEEYEKLIHPEVKI